MRLQKFMAKAGVASRRKSEEIILEGRVQVNDIVIRELGHKIDIEKDIVKVDNDIIKEEIEKVYILLNKPVGYTTTLKDKFSKNIVTDLIEGIDERIFPVGRLDQDSQGLLLLTNDGELTYKLTHPSYKIVKTYIVTVRGIPSEEHLDIIRNGIFMDGSITSKAKISFLNKNKDSKLEVKIHEGKNRQVRRMFDHINHPVKELNRIQMGSLKIENLQVGKWRKLSEKEIINLKNEVKSR